MTTIRTYILRASVVGLMLFLFGCASYNDRITPYYKNISTGNYKEAEIELDKNSLIQKPRNKLLFLMEKGRISHLLGEYENSNRYFNEADQMLEIGMTGVMDATVGVLVNPMTQRYKGEDFEKFMIHYYKALNYLYLHNTDEAVVEARRISLQTQEQGDKFNNKDKRYSQDAFSLTLQGMIYESNNDVNNAFISYRNAVEIYQKSPEQTYYGTKMPLGLEKDVIRTAYLNGFTSEAVQFENAFGIQYKPEKAPEGGELIFFWENGLAPVKVQEDLFFTLTRGDGGNLFFSNAAGGLLIPFIYTGDRDKLNIKAVESLRAAFPKYVSKPSYYSSAVIKSAQGDLILEKTEDINVLAYRTLQQRTLKEMGKILSRLAVKKIAEYALRESAKSDNQKNNTLLEGLGYGMQLYSLLSEKADTRNWQSLPSNISYARIPLKTGENEINITLKNAEGAEETKTIKVNGTGRIQFYNYSTLR
ncbi:hypothetical protein H7F33_14160 [Pedobacter sp. PAMC26386]|nr:hypothetical protein H7F33_14160 [Pedobacter sp. PAMC26386]